MKKMNIICSFIAGLLLISMLINNTVINVKANTEDKVNISVSDATGEKTIFEYSPSLPNFTSDKDIVLKGESYGDFSINSTKYNTMQYKIVKSITDSSLLNSEQGWADINLSEEKNNNDVLIDKKGFLKHRAYDVNHLSSLTDGKSWNNRNIVYKTPYSGSSIISANISKTASQYGKNESYLKDGKKQMRWVNNTIFLSNVFIDNAYKEASKIWGYIKVDETAEYNFQSFSDDGLSAYIIADGVTHKIVDGDVMFKLHGRDGVKYKEKSSETYKAGYEYGYEYKLKSSGNNSYSYEIAGSLKNVYLDKDKYYPIYIEYFNWGGGAALEMNFKKSNEAYSKYKQIPSSNFYPSKSDYPGEYSDSVFTGTDGIKLPIESGRYYIAYRAVNKDASGKITAKGEIQGTLGPYLVESHASVNVSKKILSLSGQELPLDGDKYKLNAKEFKIKYEVTPLPITLEELIADSKIPTDIEKAPKEYTMTISDAQIGVVLPDGLEYLDPKENLVVEGKKSYNSIDLNTIKYELDQDNKVYKPVTEKVSFTHSVKCANDGEYILSDDYSKLTYKDVDGANREIKFNTQEISIYGYTDIVENSLYNLSNNKKQDVSDKTVIRTMLPTTFALKVKVNGLNPKVTIKVDGIGNSQINFEKYELNKTSEIVKSTKEVKSLKGNEFVFTNEKGFKLDIDKEYLIIYELRPLKDAKNVSITVSEENENKKIQQTIKAENPPILK